MRPQQTRGDCSLCGKQFGKAAMTRHLGQCLQREAQSAPEMPPGAPALHLVVEGGWGKIYWLHLAVPSTAPLSKLDQFLRRTWLECCGHMSAFEIGGVRYSVSPMEGERGMSAALGRVVDVGTKFTYEYDFGSTTLLGLKVVGFLDRATPKNGVELLARNVPPDIKCNDCVTQPATLVCTGCDGFWLCQPCSGTHACGEDCLLPVVNSPRTGVCGYSG